MHIIRGNELELFTKKVLIVAGVVAVLLLLWAARDVAILVFIAAVLAAGISPAVRRVRVLWRFAFHKNLSRGAAVAIVYLPFVVAVLLIVVLIVPRFVDDTRELVKQLPTLIEQNVLTTLEPYVPVNFIRERLRDGVELPRSRMFAWTAWIWPTRPSG